RRSRSEDGAGKLLRQNSRRLPQPTAQRAAIRVNVGYAEERGSGRIGRERLRDSCIPTHHATLRPLLPTTLPYSVRKNRILRRISHPIFNAPSNLQRTDRSITD